MAGLVVIVALAMVQWPGTAASTLEVTYIANEGFLIKSGDQKILIDGLLRRDFLGKYLKDPGPAFTAATTAQAPFDDIDLVLITHIHYDHFNPDATLKYMAASDAAIICPEQVATQLTGAPGFRDRILAVTPAWRQSRQMTAGGFDVKVMRLKHGPYYVTNKQTGERHDRHAKIENLGFLVTMGGRSFFHIGDSGLDDPTEYPPAEMPKNGVDVLFAGSLFWGAVAEREPLVNEVIRPKNIVAMHLAPNQSPKRTAAHKLAFPNVAVFKKPFENRTF
jgi:L-ascorbate metabolism protein UlaG (beta-lactamase superfamily)